MCCPLSDIHSTVVLEYAMRSSAREKIPSDPVAGRVSRRSGTVQTENTVRHTKYGRIRGMVVGEGGRSTGVICNKSTQCF